MNLSDLITNPARLADLSREDAALALKEAKALEGALLIRLATATNPVPVVTQPERLEMLGPQQIAEAAGLTQQRVYSLIQSGELKAQKIGKYWRVRRVDFERWQRGETDR